MSNTSNDATTRPRAGFLDKNADGEINAKDFLLMWTQIKDFLGKTVWGLPMWGILAVGAAAAYYFLGGKKKGYRRR